MTYRASGRSVGVLALAAVLLVAGPASATVMLALSLEELVREADHVVVATCIDGRSSRDGNRRIVTDYDLRVEEVLKGEAAPGGRLTMRSLGGHVGDLGMRVEGEPHLSVGDRYLIFLRRTRAGRLRPVGMSQGVMAVRDESGTLSVQPGGAGLSLTQQTSRGRLVPAPPALLHPAPLADVRARIEPLVRREAGTVAP